ncbi:MAG TPA: hypothetical protein VG916_04395 [Gemmatimonadaceae bacterium]|nr:hypothetical protein [Gemmatimonadaceae bacterium]
MAATTSVATSQPRMNRGPNPDAPKLMVSACHAADKVTAALCADKIRDQIEGDVSFRSLLVMKKADVDGVLTQSGYDPAMALQPNDAVALAKQIHADFYVDADAEKNGANYKVTAFLVLARDANMRQPLGSYEHAKMETIAQQVSRGFQDAFNKTFDHQKECFTKERERNYDAALKEAADGMKDYPNSLWLRYCKLAVLKDKHAPNTEVIPLLEEIAKMDPASKSALNDLVLLYDATGNEPKKVETLEALYAADSTNMSLLAQIVNSLAAAGQMDKARPLVEKGIAKSPGDIQLVRPYWLILMAAKEYKKALDVGQQMATMDTATADTSYFFKMISAANADSNFTLAAQLADKGAVKFPAVKDFNNFAVALWRKAGDNAKSVAAAERAMKADPSAKNMRAPIAMAYLSEKPPKLDEAIAMAKEMITAGEDKNQIAAIAVQAGNLMRTQADSLKAAGADAATARANTEKVYTTLAWADSLATGTSVAPQAKFLLGVAALGVGQAFLTDAGDISKKLQEDFKAASTNDAKKKVLEEAYPRACEAANKADEYFTIANGAVPAGGRFDPKAAQQVMGSLMQLNGYVDQMKKAYCKKP